MSGENSRLDWLSNSLPYASGTFQANGGSVPKGGASKGAEETITGIGGTVLTFGFCLNRESLLLCLFLPILRFTHPVCIHSNSQPSPLHDWYAPYFPQVFWKQFELMPEWPKIEQGYFSLGIIASSIFFWTLSHTSSKVPSSENRRWWL